MKKTLQKWIVLAVLACVLGGVAVYYDADCSRAKSATVLGWKAKLEGVQRESDEVASQYSEERLAEARKKAEQTKNMLKSAAHWVDVRTSIQSSGIFVSEVPSRVSDRDGAPTRLMVTLSFANLPASDDKMRILSDAIRTMDSEFAGCQRVALSLPPPVNNGGLPRGFFNDGSEAVYEFHVLK